MKTKAYYALISIHMRNEGNTGRAVVGEHMKAVIIDTSGIAVITHKNSPLHMVLFVIDVGGPSPIRIQFTSLQWLLREKRQRKEKRKS